jgi:hypothetical protein
VKTLLSPEVLTLSLSPMQKKELHHCSLPPLDFRVLASKTPKMQSRIVLDSSINT